MLKAYLADFKRYLPLLFSLTARDIKLKYRRSVLGIAWSVLNPLLIMIVMTNVFAFLLKAQPERMPFAVYFITGSTLFNFFTEATSGSMSSIMGNSALIKKVYIPKYIFPLEKCLFSFVNMLFSMIAVVLVMGFFMLTGSTEIDHVFFHPTIIFFFIPILFTFFFSVGVSLILSALAVYFRDLLHLWGVITTIWMYMTPIIYPISLAQKNPIFTKIILCNPFYYFVDSFRGIMVLGEFPGIKTLMICFISCVVVLVIGTIVFRKAQDRFILHI